MIAALVVFTGWMAFLLPNQQHQIPEGIIRRINTHYTSSVIKVITDVFVLMDTYVTLNYVHGDTMCLHLSAAFT